MTEKEITTAKEILKEENLLSLGFKNIGKTADRYFGEGYQYKDFHNIRIEDFMGIRSLGLDGSNFISRELLKEEGLADAFKRYKIYDTVNKDVNIDIHSNEELVTICEKWASAIKAAGIKKAERLKEYYKNL